MERYGTHCEQTYRTNFNRSRSKCINWVKFNLALSRRYLNMDGLLAIAINTRTAEQKLALIELLKHLKQQFPKAAIHGHRDFAAKACPSFDATKEYANI